MPALRVREKRIRAMYPAKYRDNSGEEMTSISNDGKMLSLVVRGVEFRGSDAVISAAVPDEDGSVTTGVY